MTRRAVRPDSAELAQLYRSAYRLRSVICAEEPCIAGGVQLSDNRPLCTFRLGARGKASKPLSQPGRRDIGSKFDRRGLLFAHFVAKPSLILCLAFELNSAYPLSVAALKFICCCAVLTLAAKHDLALSLI